MLFILRTSEGVLYGLKEAFENSADSILLEQESADYGPKTKSSLLPVRAKNGLYSFFFNCGKMHEMYHLNHFKGSVLWC